MVKRQLYLIDATAFCYRAFYAIRGLATSFGQPTNAIYGFLNMLQKVLKEHNPGLLAVCFDVSRDTFRQKKFADYKIQRPPSPDDLISQMPFIKQIIAAYGIAVCEREGYEADDVIATLAQEAGRQGIETVIISSDKDILQLVDDTTRVVSPAKDGDVIYDADKVEGRFGVRPAQITDIIALMGDGIDNIPGVPGIGEKTAANLINEFGNLDALMDNIAGVKQEKIRKALDDCRQQIALSRELAVLDRNVPLGIDIEDLRPGTPDYKELFRLFKYLEFKALLKNLSPQASSVGPQAREVDDEEILSLFKENGGVILSGTSFEDAIAGTSDAFIRVKTAGKNTAGILADAGITKIGHDLKKLKVSFSREGRMLNGLHFDTMIAAYVLNPTRGAYSLNEIATDYLNEPTGDPDIHTVLSLIARLKPRLDDQLKQQGLMKLFTGVELPLIEVLADMEIEGITLDRSVIASLSRHIEKRLVELVESIYETSGCQFNINSPKQLRDVLFEKLKLPVIKRTKTGPSTDEEVLSGLAQKHELPALLLEYRQLTKLKNTYVDTLPLLIDPKTGKVHTSFNQTGTETGRLSSSAPNLQNIPVKTEIGRKLRQAIISSGPSRQLLSCDYSQIELRILAHLSKDRNLIEAFKENKDIHRATAALIYGVGEHEVDDPMRDTAKRVNFGIIYGLTSYGLSRDLKIPVEESQVFIDAYFNRYSGVKTYIQEQIARAEKDGYVVTLLGRQRALPQIKDKNQGIRQFAQRQAVNTPVQGSAADLIKLAMLAVHKKLNARSYRTKLILQVHDELVFDVPDDELKDLCGLVRECMEHVLVLDVPIKVDMKKGKNWLQMEALQ